MSAINSELIARARKIFPGGALGSFILPDDLDMIISRASDGYLYDSDGRRYIDFVLGSGPMILGHRHPAVVEAVKMQIERGSTYYALNEPAIRLAEKIQSAVPCAEKVKFCGSGSEATFYALRLARAVTGKQKVLKFEGAYHGHHDYAMMSVAPGASRNEPYPAAIPDTAGIPGSLLDQVLIAPFNDLQATKELLEKHASEVAAVIVEPQCRLLDPQPGFLEGLREVTRRLGIILIFDEVVTGFRLAWGGAQEYYGVVPDLACYGKIIGGGYPLAAVAGPADILELSNPRKSGHDPQSTYISGTLNGNPLAATAGLATLIELEKPDCYARLNALGARMRDGLRKISASWDIPAQVLGAGPMANIYFTSERVVDYRSLLRHNSKMAAALGRKLLVSGIFTHLSAKMYMSLAHSDADVDALLQVFGEFVETDVTRR
jgi:glutamate-1-semialdehyde 2,1-aminomutase